MSRPLDIYDGIAVASLVIYFFFLAAAVVLCLKHGFVRSSGWRFLIVLALARIIGSALRLGTIADPSNLNLYIGWQTLNGIGLGPLILILLGLLGRVFDSINRQGHVLVQPLHQRLIETMMLVAIILLIVGGTESNFTFENGQPKVDYSDLTRAGTGLMIAVLALLCLEVLLAFRNQGYVSQGDHRIIVAVIASLPFILVRLIYSCIVVFAGVTSNAGLYLGMLVIMEMMVVAICEVLGFTLNKAPPPMPKDDAETQRRPDHDGVENTSWSR